MLKIRENYILPPITLLHVILEFAFIIGCILFFVAPMIFTPANLMIGNLNYPTAVLQSEYAVQVFQRTGHIPMWDPFIGNGEPMFENLATSILNPLMTWPFMFFGAIQGGKVATLIHAFLIAFGGWSLARVLRLNWAGRVLLALLLFGNGSMVSQFGQGFIHLAFPQVYIPWVFTGLFATLYMRRRWGIAMLGIATAMMAFAGGIWYVLPVAIACALVSVFALIDLDVVKRTFQIDPVMLRNLVIGVVFIFGIGAVRWITFNPNYVYHPTASVGPGTDFLGISSAYFFPRTPQPQFSDTWINYHYVIPAAVALLLVVLRLFVYRPREDYRVGMWRILFPAAITILFLTVWAEGDTPFTQWLYSTIPQLANWKNAGRIAAGATPWIALIGAIWLDDIVNALVRAIQRRRRQEPVEGLVPALMNRFHLKPQPAPMIARVLLVGLVVVTFVLSMDVLRNWNTVAGLSYIDQWDRGESLGLNYLRKLYPGQFLVVGTAGWINHFGFTNTMTRTAHGDATIFTVGNPSTVGPDPSMGLSTDFAVGSNPDFITWLTQHGYLPVPGAPTGEGYPVAWFNPDSTPYAFWVERSKLDGRDWHPLTRGEVNPVTYYQRVDDVDIEVADHASGAVVVADETNYPGWQVTVDGQPATLESVGNRLGVVLPDKPDGAPLTHVTFSYRPSILYWGGFWTILTSVLCTLFLFRVDQRIHIPETVKNRVMTAAQKAMTVLTDPGILESEEEAKARDVAANAPPRLSAGIPIPEDTPPAPQEVNPEDQPADQPENNQEGEQAMPPEDEPEIVEE